MDNHTLFCACRHGRRYMLLISFFSSLVFYAPIATLYRTSLGITLSQIFIAEASSYALQLLLEIPSGRLSDTIGYKKCLLLGYTLLLISKVIFYLVNDFPLFLAERLAMAIAFALISGADIAYLDRAGADKKTHSYSTALQISGICIVSLVYPLVSTYKMSALLTIISHTILLGFVILLPGLKRGKYLPKMDTNTTGLRMQRPKTPKGFLLSSAAFGALSAVSSAMEVFIIQLYYAERLLADNWYGLPLLISNLVAITAPLVFIHLKTKILLPGFILLYLLSLSSLLFTSSATGAIIAVIVLCFASTGIRPIFSYYQMKSTKSAHQAEAISWSMAVAESASLLVYLCISFFATFGTRLATKGLILITGISATILFVGLQSHKLKYGN